MSPVPVALLLLRASRWFDRQLLDGLEAEGWPRLTPAQSLVFAHLDPAGVAPATLARRLGTTRQGVQELVAGLVRRDLLAVQDDPTRRGGRLVVLTDTGLAVTADARRLLAELEHSLGEQRIDQLRSLLTELDGPPRPGPHGQDVAIDRDVADDRVLDGLAGRRVQTDRPGVPQLGEASTARAGVGDRPRPAEAR